MDGNVLFSPQDTNTANTGSSQGTPMPSVPTGTQPIVPQTPPQSVPNPVSQPIPQAPDLQVNQPPNVMPLQVSPQPVTPIQQGSFVPQQSNQPTGGVQSIPQSQPPIQQPPITPPQMPTVPPAADATTDSPKITLEDLYGPSSHAVATPTSARPSVQAPNVTPVVENTSVTTAPQQVVEAPAPVAAAVQAEASEPQPQEVKAEDPAFSIASGAPQVYTASPSASSPAEKQQPASVAQEPVENGGGGFHFPPILMKLLGGLVVALIILVLISFVSSLFKKNTGNDKVTLTYWGLWEDSNVMQGVINDFEREHPNITITYTKQDPVKYTDRLLTRMQSGTGPDIFRFHNSWTAPLQSILLPLPADVLDKKQLDQNYFPVISKDLVQNGALYGLPLEMDNLVLYTNKDIFDHAGAKVPTTWEEFVTVAKGLTVKDSSGKIKTAGAAIGTYDNITHAPDIISLLLLQNGADLQKLSGSQNATDALNFYTSFAKTDDKVWDSSLDSSLLAFSRGKVAMFFGYSYDYFAIKAAAPQLNFEIHPVPHLPGRDMTVASYWVEGVSNRSKHQNEALLFMKYLAQKDVMAKLYTDEAKTRSFGEIYPRSDLANNLSSDPILSSFVSQAKTAVSSFFVSDTQFDSFNGGLNRYLGNAINSMFNDTSTDTALSTLGQGVSQIFNQYAAPTQ